MKRPGTKNVLRVVAGFVAVVLLLLAVLSLVPARTPTIAGRDAIASLVRVRIGGVGQWLSIRGRDVANPVLLHLHGGPGLANIARVPGSTALLEEKFVVVQWDQRGAGKSCTAEVADESLTLEQYLADTLEVVNWLRQRFGQQKIYLVGHSWGSVLGAIAVQRHPELFHAYVGMGQVVDARRGEEISYRFVKQRAQAEGNTKALADLSRIAPPYGMTEELMLQRQWLAHYHGDVLSGNSAANILRRIFFAPEYTVGEKGSFYGCLMNSLDKTWNDLAEINFISSITRLEVPVYLFTGRHDYNVPFELVEEWAEVLEAPHVEIVWFENSAHFMPSEQPARFQKMLIDKVLRETRDVERPAAK